MTPFVDLPVNLQWRSPSRHLRDHHLRPATPTNIPFIGQTRVGKLWVNAGHGTLGWTHGAGSGKAMAELLSGEVPAMNFGFLGVQAPRAVRGAVAA